MECRRVRWRQPKLRGNHTIINSNRPASALAVVDYVRRGAPLTVRLGTEPEEDGCASTPQCSPNWSLLAMECEF